MALKKAGVVLSVENYADYLNKLNSINRAHKEAFNSSNFKSYEQAAKKVGQSFKGIEVNPPDLKAFNRSLDEASTKSKGLWGGFSNAIRPAIGDVGDLTSMIGGMLAKFTLVAAALKLVNDAIAFFNGSLALAQRNETLAVSLQEIGSQAGYSAKQIKLATALLNKQGITTQAAQQSLLLMARANISWAEASKLASIAQGSAVVAGMNSSQAFERLVRGIQKMEPELLDELGITLRRTDAYEKFAATMGKNAKELDETEKKQAILNAIYEQSESVIGVYGAAMETSGKQQASLARYIEETQTNLGKLMLPMAGARIEMETNFWKAAQQLSKGLSDMVPILESLGTGWEQFNHRISLNPEALKGYDEAKNLLKRLGVEGQTAGAMVAQAMEGIRKGSSQKDLLTSLSAQFEAQGSNAKEADQQAKILLASLQQYDVAIKQMAETRTFWDRLGEAIFNFSKVGAMAFVGFITVVEVAAKEVKQRLGLMEGAFKILAAIAEKDYVKAAILIEENSKRIGEAVDIDFGTEFQSNMKGFLDKFPGLTKAWGDLNETIEGTPDDLRLPGPEDVEDTTAAIEEQVTALEALKGAYESIQSIQKTYQKEIASAEKDYQKGLAEAEKKYQADKAKMIADQAKKVMEFDAETSRKRAKMLDDFAFEQKQNAQKFELSQSQNKESFNLKQKQDERKFHDDMLREARRFQLSMMQAQRTQQISDRRMRADGDVIALMEAREDFANQQQINQENFNLQKEESKKGYEDQGKLAIDNFKLQEEQAKQSFAMQTEMQREEFQRRVADFDANAALEREKMLAANAQALIDLDVKYEEEKAKLLEQYQEKVALAEEHRQEQMAALGDSMKEEGKITEEGMKEIQAKVEEVFGEGAGGDALIKGWTDRTKDEMSALVDEVTAEIARLKGAMESGIASSAPSSAGSYPGGKPGFDSQSVGNQPPSYHGNQNKKIGARHGYQGTVTGPATFDVEPGVKEHVSFTPASRFGNVKVGGRVGVDVSGMSQGVSPMVEESVANTFLEEIKIAIRRVSRRHS